MAEPPFEVGDKAVAFVLHRDHVTVHTTRVERIEPSGDRWKVMDDLAMSHEVDRHGNGADLVPLDDFLRHELKTRGEGFIVLPEGKLLDPPVIEPRLIEPELIEPDLDRDLGSGRDGIG